MLNKIKKGPSRITLVILLCLAVVMIPMALGEYSGSGKVRAAGCPTVANTPSFSFAYGLVQLDGTSAPIGTVVEASSPRGDVVGCFEVTDNGAYGAMYVYGEDTSVSPAIPGMRDGEIVAFHVDGVQASAVPELAWHDDRDLHQVDLDAQTPAPLDAPSNLSASATSQTEIRVSWQDNSSGESAFHVERSTDGGQNWTQAGSTGTGVTTFDDSGRTCGSTYHYRVRAFRESDASYSGYSNVDSATTDACPLDAPSNLSASATSQTEIRVSWQDNSSGESAFHVERSTDGGQNWTQAGSTGTGVTTFDDSGRACGSTYHYRVRAFRDSDAAYSAYSNVDSDTTQSCGGGSLDIMISEFTDDAEEKLTDGDVAIKSVDLELGEDSNPQIVGLRFQNVDIPPGASITSASIVFTADETHSDDTDLVFHGQASDDAATFDSADNDISARPQTSASVAWNNVAPWSTVHATYQSPDLAPIIQEIVNRPGWSSGNSLAILIDGSGKRTAESYNGEPDMAPRLLVEFGSSQPPTCYTLTLSHTGSGSDPVPSPVSSQGCAGGQYVAGQNIGLSASPAADWAVASWSGTDNDGSAATTNQVTMPAASHAAAVNYAEAPPGGSVDIMVRESTDDAEEKLTDGDVAIKSVDLELGEDRDPQIVGLRFQNVEIPQGASISSASIVFTADETHSDDTDLVIHGQASDDAPAFDSADNDISARSQTSASVAWNNVAPWSTVHATYQSPDLAPIVQEIVNRTGWSSGNSLAVLIDGSGKRTAESYNGEPDMAPRLLVDYGSGQPPTCYTLTTGVDPASSGSISANPQPNCGAGQYSEGTQVQLSAQAAAGYTFDHWSGSLSGSANPQTLTMDAAKTATAHFVASDAGPLVYDGHGIDDDQQDDSDGNGDGVANCGEAIELYVDLANQGATTITGISASLSTSDPYVAWLYTPTSGYPDLPAGGSGTNSSDFDLRIDAGAPHGHIIAFDLQATAADGGPWSDSFGLQVTCGGGSSQNLDVRVIDKYDDAEERLNSGDVILKGSDLELVEDTSTQAVGLRFQNITIPQGATITSATVEFTADETHDGATDLLFHGQAADNAPSFGDADGDISDRPLTGASATWNNVPAWTAVHDIYESVDLAPIVQEIVNRGGWASGNSLVIVVTGSGKRVAESYEGGADMAPLLHVTYTGP